MKLTELNPNWARKDLSERTAVSLDCPVCKAHKIIVPFKGEQPIWTLEGDDFSNLTMRPSVAHETHYADGMGSDPRLCKSHFYITNGEIEIL